jgi:tungstate transport system substrate-binding protein
MSVLRKPILALLAILGTAVFLVGRAPTLEKSIVVASTTSPKDSGLYDYLLPLFTEKTGIAVKVLALGTGQALDAARHDMADVVFVHAKSAEQTFVAEGQAWSDIR